MNGLFMCVSVSVVVMSRMRMGMSNRGKRISSMSFRVDLNVFVGAFSFFDLDTSANIVVLLDLSLILNITILMLMSSLMVSVLHVLLFSLLICIEAVVWFWYLLVLELAAQALNTFTGSHLLVKRNV